MRRAGRLRLTPNAVGETSDGLLYEAAEAARQRFMKKPEPPLIHRCRRRVYPRQPAPRRISGRKIRSILCQSAMRAGMADRIISVI